MRSRAVQTGWLALAIVVAATAVDAMAADVQASVPARFQGEWAASARQCGAAGDDSRLRIGAADIRFQESRGLIKAVVTRGEGELALISELSGEGETWLSANIFRLAADQQTLTDITGGTEFARVRCAKSAR